MIRRARVDAPRPIRARTIGSAVAAVRSAPFPERTSPLPTASPRGPRRSLSDAVLAREADAVVERAPSPSIRIVGLNAPAGRLLGRLALSVPSPYADLETSLISSFQLTAAFAPPKLIRELRRFGNDPTAEGALLVRGLPIDPELPATPKDGGRATEKQTFVSEVMLLGVMQMLGQPFGFTALKQGEIVHNICPVKGSEGVQSNEGSEKDFDFHIESAFSERRPAHLALLCLRADHEGLAKTTLVSAQRAYDRLSPETKALLREPRFVTNAPASWKALAASGAASTPRPAVTGPESMIELCANLQTTRGLDGPSQRALQALEQELHDPALEEHVKLRPGDLLVVDNRKVLHGRTTFQARYDGQDRWLQRVYTVGDLWAGRSETATNPRIRDGY